MTQEMQKKLNKIEDGSPRYPSLESKLSHEESNMGRRVTYVDMFEYTWIEKGRAEDEERKVAFLLYDVEGFTLRDGTVSIPPQRRFALYEDDDAVVVGGVL